RRQTFNLEFRIIRADGQVRWISASGGAFYDDTTGEPTRILGNNIDITERKLAEAQLAERNAQFALASKCAKVGSFTCDYATGSVQLSPGSATMYGLPEATNEISLQAGRALVHPDDLAHVDQAFAAAFSRRQREVVLNFRIRSRGEVRWIEERVLVSYDEG